MNNASPDRKSPALPFSFCTRVLGVVLLLGSLANSFAASSFLGLGSLHGQSVSLANAISSDGKVVVGRAASDSGEQAFRWTASRGMLGLGKLPGGSSGSVAHGVSADGSVIVGESAWARGRQAFRWTASGGMVGLGCLPNGSNSGAYAVSGDGRTVVGYSDCAPGFQAIQAFRWTKDRGMLGIRPLPNGHNGGALALNHDGSVIVGNSGNQAFRWTEAGGVVGLGFLPDGCRESLAFGTSGDGWVVVGQSCRFRFESKTAFRWTATGGMISLGKLPDGFTGSVAKGVSGDGSIVVGIMQRSSPTDEAFIWESVNGMQSLQSMLTKNYKLLLTGWKLMWATGISADGRTIIGNGQHNGRDEAWVAHLDRPVNAVAGKEGGK